MESPRKDLPGYAPLKELVTAIEKKLSRFLDKYGNTDLRLAMITVVLIILTGGDALLIVHNKFVKLSTSPAWLHIEKQSHDILTTQSIYPTGHHVSKMTFRLVAPLLGKLCFGCSLHKLMYFLVGLDYVAGFLFIFLFIKFIRKYIPDNETVRWLTLCIGFVFLGKIFFWDLGYFDGFALVSLFIAMMSNRIPIQFIFFLTAFWTDERSVFALPLIWIWYLMRDKTETDTWPAAIPRYSFFEIKKGHWALLLALALTLVTRWFLVEYYHFSTSVDFAQLVKETLNIFRRGRLLSLFPFILFSSFESLWLIIILAFYISWQNRAKLEVIFVTLAGFLAIGSAFLVADITRSIMYGFPVLIISIRVVAAYVQPQQLRRISFYILLFAMIYPTYYMTDYMFPFFLKSLITRSMIH